jgi:gamma-glutamylcysteine synthetase
MPNPISELAEQYAARFRETAPPLRLVGRELEFPLVNADGTAGDIRRLWPRLVREGNFTPKYDDPATSSGHSPETQPLIVALSGDDGIIYEAEVGLGTVEMLTPACEDLFQLEAVMQKGLTRLTRAAEAEGMRVLGFGIQPRTPRSPNLMTPKKRYGALLNAIGKPWLHFCTTAADQLHVDITRDELVPMLNWMNFVSGVIIALVANSSVYAGRAGQFVSGREGLLGALGAHRNGMTPRKFKSLEDFMTFICAHPCYVLKNADGSLTQYGRPFNDYLVHRPLGFSKPKGSLLDAYLWHEHYTWNSARARVEHSTIEIRPACQQPRHELMAASALSLGLVEALPQIEEYVTRVLGADPWPTMLRYRRAVVRDGLRAAEPAKKFLQMMIQLAEDGLRRRGRGEEKWLAPLWKRLEKKRTPADEACALFNKKGMDALIEALTIHRSKQIGFL